MLKPYAFRLTQGADLKLAILNFVQTHSIQAGSLLSGVGCLASAIYALPMKVSLYLWLGL